MKQHTNSLLTRCVLPLMCFNDEDDELWREDPHEYIRKVPSTLLFLSFSLTHVTRSTNLPACCVLASQSNMAILQGFERFKVSGSQCW